MPEENIIIIGGGIAGLTAAYELRKRNKNIIILEARSRLGGRIHTLNDNAFLMPVEAGAEFMHGDLPETINLLKEAGIPYYQIEGRMFRFKNGELHKEENFTDYDRLLAKKLNELEHDMSVDEFLNTYFGDEKYTSTRNSIRGFVEGYDAADTKRASALAFRNEWLQEDDWKQYRIKGGYQKLIDFLAKEVKANGGRIILDAIVKEIKWNTKPIEIITKDQKKCSADRVIVTVPLGVLQDKGEAAIVFNPSINEKLEAARVMGYGGVIKILLKFKEVFWKNESFEKRLGTSLEKLSFLLSDATIPTWWTQLPEPIPILIGWLGGPKAEKFSSMTEEELLHVALKSLSHIFQMSESNLKDKLAAFHVINWIKDPYALGAYTYATVDSMSAVKELSTPVENKLFFAGEAIYDGTSIGTVEAAIVSGRKVAEQILNS